MIKEENTDFDATSVYSDSIPLNNNCGYNNLKVLLSFYGNSMDFNNQFCSDYSSNRPLSWMSGVKFENRNWNDNMLKQFQPSVNFVTAHWNIRFNPLFTMMYNYAMHWVISMSCFTATALGALHILLLLHSPIFEWVHLWIQMLEIDMQLPKAPEPNITPT